MSAAAIRTHLFIIAPNNSGSTVLRNTIAASSGCWQLPREAQHVPGFAGPTTRGSGTRLIWASRPEWREVFADPARYDWPRSAAAWTLQAQAGDPDASVLVLSSPPFLFTVAALNDAFPDARFIHLVRNPYAAVEGICRRADQQPLDPGEDIRTVAARHIATCLRQQQHNLGQRGTQAVSLTYEDMCRDPVGAAARILTLAPELGALDLHTAVPVKGMYREPLRDMNADQIARLSPADLMIINDEFDAHPGLLTTFGYERLS